MKKIVLVAVLLLSLTGVAWLQTISSPADLATLMPSGASLYLRASNFGDLLNEWNRSPVKRDWLSSESYSVFQQSNLFQKLSGVYDEYSAAASFVPELKGVAEIAGSESALALYDIHNVEFLYVSRIPESQLSKAQLWGSRNKFQQREAAGVPFWLRKDPASGRSVAFAFTQGYLLAATRDDLVARSLQILAGGKEPNLAAERWYREAIASAKTPGELRLVMNMNALTESVYFRSYWVQRNVSPVRQYWAGIADIGRSSTAIQESRVFLRKSDDARTGPEMNQRAALSQLVSQVPDAAGFYRAWVTPDAATASGLIFDRLITPHASISDRMDYAPAAADLTQTAGTEADLEMRIDEPPLVQSTSENELAAPLRALITKTRLNAALLVESSMPNGPTFVRIPCAVALSSPSSWDQTAVEAAISQIAGPLWSSSGLGTGWQTTTAGTSAVRSVNGLGSLYLSSRGNVLYLANDAALLGEILNHSSSTASGSPVLTAMAAFRFSHERGRYGQLMNALDFNGAANGATAPALFSQNLGSLGRVLSPIDELIIRQEDEGTRLSENVVYRLRSASSGR